MLSKNWAKKTKWLPPSKPAVEVRIGTGAIGTGAIGIAAMTIDLDVDAAAEAVAATAAEAADAAKARAAADHATSRSGLTQVHIRAGTHPSVPAFFAQPLTLLEPTTSRFTLRTSFASPTCATRHSMARICRPNGPAVCTAQGNTNASFASVGVALAMQMDAPWVRGEVLRNVPLLIGPPSNISIADSPHRKMGQPRPCNRPYKAGILKRIIEASSIRCVRL